MTLLPERTVAPAPRTTARRPRSRTRSRLAVAAGAWCALVLMALAPAALAQPDELDQTILESPGAWTNTQAAEVRAFVDGHLAEFEGEDPEAIAEAREALLKPLNDLRAGTAFQSQYFRVLSERLREKIGGFSVIGKINGMMLARRIVDRSTIDVLKIGLGDESSAGVRFVAAKSIGEVIPNSELGLSDADKRGLIEALAASASTEPDAFAAGKMLDAMRSVDLGVRATPTLAVFNARVPLHAANPNLSYQPELTGMQDMLLRGSGEFNAAQRRSFVQAAARYLALIATQLEAGELETENKDVALRLVTQSETILDLLKREVGLQGVMPNPVARYVPVEDWAGLKEVGSGWVEKLKAHGPLNLDDDDLNIEAPGGAAPTEEAVEAGQGDGAESGAVAEQ